MNKLKRLKSLNRGGKRLKISKQRGGKRLKISKRGGKRLKISKQRGGKRLKISKQRGGGKPIKLSLRKGESISFIKDIDNHYIICDPPKYDGYQITNFKEIFPSDESKPENIELNLDPDKYIDTLETLGGRERKKFTDYIKSEDYSTALAAKFDVDICGGSVVPKPNVCFSVYPYDVKLSAIKPSENIDKLIRYTNELATFLKSFHNNKKKIIDQLYGDETHISGDETHSGFKYQIIYNNNVFTYKKKEKIEAKDQPDDVTFKKFQLILDQLKETDVLYDYKEQLKIAVDKWNTNEINAQADPRFHKKRRGILKLLNFKNEFGGYTSDEDSSSDEI